MNNTFPIYDLSWISLFKDYKPLRKITTDHLKKIRYPLTLSSFYTLLAIQLHNQTGLTAHAIGKFTGQSRKNIGRVIQLLIMMRLVAIDEEDSHQNRHLHLTQSGEFFMHKWTPPIQDYFKAQINRLDEPQQIKLANTLNALAGSAMPKYRNYLIFQFVLSNGSLKSLSLPFEVNPQASDDEILTHGEFIRTLPLYSEEMVYIYHATKVRMLNDEDMSPVKKT